MPQLPVGQHEVKNWPVLDLGEQPEVPLAKWKLEVGGLVEHPFVLSWDEFLALPQADDVSDFHCDARFVLCTGSDFMPGTFIPYTTNLPLNRAIDDDVLLVHTWEGKPLPPEHGGPVRMITPKLYAWKGAKWIRKIEFLAEDRKGFWEVRGYSNSAEPWYNDRYATD
ncbi:MAG: molybdopterin-dependent oxidoreductase [Acidobacteria bacterium]|nr:molybdopterin-dependent oxidoreductase [Acidobacteriota bacterium]